MEDGTLHINRVLTEYGSVGDLSVRDGRFYPSKAPLLSFAAAPIYAALRFLKGGDGHAVPELLLVYLARLFLTVLPTLGMLILLWRLLRAYVSEPVADAVTATYAVGSLGFSYSLLFMSHQTTAVLLFASFYALWRCARGEWRERGYLVAGAFAGAAVAAEYTSAIGLAGLVLYATLSLLSLRTETWRTRLIQWARAMGLAAVGAAPFFGGLLLYHQACFGHPLRTGYLYLNDPEFQPWHTGGLLGIGVPDLRAFVESFFSPLRGLFVLAPFLLLAIPGLVVLCLRPSSAAPSGAGAQPTSSVPADRSLFWFVASLLLGYGYFTSAFSYESWGWTTGPRHLTALVPFLLLPVATRMQELRDDRRLFGRIALGVAAAVCVLSIMITGAATLVNYVPDSASNAFFGVVLPLFKRGFLGPTVWAMLGIPNFWPAVLVLLALVAVAALVTRQLLGSDRVPALAGFVTCAIYLAVLSIHSGTDADERAVAHLQTAWVTYARR